MSVFVIASSDGGFETEWFDSLAEAQSWIDWFAGRGWKVTVKENA